MRAATVGIVRHVSLALGILPFDVARHSAVVTTATLEVAYCVLFFHLYCFACDKLKTFLFIKCRPIIHGCHRLSAYGAFLRCHLQRGRDENALISYGIL